MRSFYIAASSEAQRIAVERRLDLEKRGFKVTSRWHFVQLSINVPKSARDMDEMARVDLKDIEEAEEFIILTEPPNQRGGRHVEMGYALALGKPIHLIGVREMNPFQFLIQIKQYDKWDQFLGVISENR